MHIQNNVRIPPQYSLLLLKPCSFIFLSCQFGHILNILICFEYSFRFKSDEERTPVHQIVEETFPNLLNIFNRLVQIVNPALEVADLIKLICKIFWSSIYVRSYYCMPFEKCSFCWYLDCMKNTQWQCLQFVLWSHTMEGPITCLLEKTSWNLYLLLSFILSCSSCFSCFLFIRFFTYYSSVLISLPYIDILFFMRNNWY